MMLRLLASLACMAACVGLADSATPDLLEWDLSEVPDRERRAETTTSSTEAPDDRAEPLVLLFTDLDYDTTDLTALEANIRAEFGRLAVVDYETMTITLSKGSVDPTERRAASGITAACYLKDASDKGRVAAAAAAIVKTAQVATTGPSNSVVLSFGPGAVISDFQLATLREDLDDKLELLGLDDTDYVFRYDASAGDVVILFTSGADVGDVANGLTPSDFAVGAVGGSAVTPNVGSQFVETDSSADAENKVGVPLPPFCDEDSGGKGGKKGKGSSKRETNATAVTRQNRTAAPDARVDAATTVAATTAKTKAGKGSKSSAKPEGRASGSGAAPEAKDTAESADVKSGKSGKVKGRERRGGKGPKQRRSGKGSKEHKASADNRAEREQSGSGPPQTATDNHASGRSKNAKGSKDKGSKDTGSKEERSGNDATAAGVAQEVTEGDGAAAERAQSGSGAAPEAKETAAEAEAEAEARHSGKSNKGSKKGAASNATATDPAQNKLNGNATNTTASQNKQQGGSSKSGKAAKTKGSKADKGGKSDKSGKSNKGNKGDKQAKVACVPRTDTQSAPSSGAMSAVSTAGAAAAMFVGVAVAALAVFRKRGALSSADTEATPLLDGAQA